MRYIVVGVGLIVVLFVVAWRLFLLPGYYQIATSRDGLVVARINTATGHIQVFVVGKEDRLSGRFADLRLTLIAEGPAE